MLQYIVILATTYGIWRLLGFCYRRSPLDNIPGPPSPSWLAGHLLQLYDKQGWDFHRDLETKYGPVSRLQSMFGQPMLCVYDPLAMQSIVLKDQHIFEEMYWYQNLTLDTLGPGLVSTTGETHRKQRKLVSPVFSSKNLRRASPIIYEVAHRLKMAMKSAVDSGAPELDIAHYMSRASLEMMARAILGRSFDTLSGERRHPYAKALSSFMPALANLSRYIQLYRFARPLIPPPLRRPILNLLPSRRVKNLLGVIDALHTYAVQIYTEKKKECESLGVASDEDQTGKDLVTILVHANAGASSEDAVSEEEVIAQLTTVVFAGTDTTSNALCTILECLAENSQAQDQLRAEIVGTKSRHENGDIPYDTLIAMPYLDAVYKETLRMRVTAPLRARETRADGVLPLSKPIRGKDGTMIDCILVPEGTLVFIPIQASNVNPDIWGADARTWRPERWLEPLPETLTEAKIPGVYANLMTFWGGGRACIGFAFAQLEIKIVLAELLSTFRFEKTDAPVVWNLGEVIYPTVGTDSDSLHPAYPMKVTLVKPDGVSARKY
ncbi:cytochrome P450 [Pilatotrama ljubarskyi]|nr:cytochrome P450 [Pilatotrama ljubarskyi]